MEKKTPLYEAGLKTRTEVLGKEYVDNAFKSADAFNLPFQEFITEYAWGGVWTRPGLDRKTRSFLNLGMLAALNRPHEIKIHVRGALNNGLTKGGDRGGFLSGRDLLRRACCAGCHTGRKRSL